MFKKIKELSYVAKMNLIFGSFFAILAITAFIFSFFGAIWQMFVALIGAIMAWAILIDFKKEVKDGK